MATEEGIVVHLNAPFARVRTTRSSACKACSARRSCHPDTAGQEMEVDAVNPVGAGIGDRILLHVETASLLKATFLLYLFPVLCMLVGAALGQWLATRWGWNDSAVSAGAAFLALAVSFMLVRRKAGRMAQQDLYRPKIVKVIRPSG